MERPNVFAGGTLERAVRQRADARWIESARAAPDARFVVGRESRFLVAGDDPPRPAFLDAAQAGALRAAGAFCVFLGLDCGAARFALDVSGDDGLAEAAVAQAPGARFESLRGVAGLMAAPEAALLAYASGLLYWHARHRFCGVCGAPTEPRSGGHLRRCANPDCAADHFPRTDPAVIMLVTDGARCLLGRQRRWPEGLYSTLAGFVEPGESLEEAVRREVREEAGVRVGAVRYHSSQPWPFPGSIMLGFVARAETTEIAIDGDELEDARWFTREALREAGREVRLPNSYSIARRLVEDWLAGRED